ncbi:MAG TPA: hypothetical protein VFR17_04365 [Mycobacterium sp.]|nr:hypothetical protein [Mycobacterium sp.]
MRFNPPPNWPAAPPGWVPDSNWRPDPSWPPPPPGWPLWVDESGFPVGPQPPRRSRKALWAALIAAAVVVVAGSLFAVFALGVGRGAGGGKTSAKPDITELTRDLLVGKSAFPEFEGGRRTSGVGNAGKEPGASDIVIDPAECADFYGYPKSATQSAYAAVSKAGRGGIRSMEVRLAITPDRTNLKDAVAHCRTFSVSLGRPGAAASVETQLDPLEVADLPSWAVATVMKSSSSPLPGIPLVLSMTTTTISGYYRGVLITARNNEFSRRGGDGSAPVEADSVDELMRLFKAQVDQLEAAP